MNKDTSSASVGRRELLGLAGAALTGLAGCPGDQNGESSPAQPSATQRTRTVDIDTAYVDRFDSIVNVVDAGADPEGSRSIDEVVREQADDGTVLVFPDGKYRLDRLSMPIPDNFGMVAAADSDPAIVPTGHNPTNEWLLFSDATDFVYDGIDIDVRESGQIGGTVFSGPGQIEVRNLRVRGGYDTVDQQLMRIDVTEEDGVGIVENVVASGVDKPDVDTTGLYVGRTHAGTITFRDCRLERFSDNALYASAPGGDGGQFDSANGTVHVRGGLFKNNNISGIRIGSTGSTVKNATVIVDEEPRHPDESLNARGIRLRGKRDQLVENCRLVYGPDAGETTGALTINGKNGHATIRNVDIEMNRDGTRAILAKRPEIDGDVAPTFENVTVRGTAGTDQAVTINGRPGTTFDGCCIRQTGDQRDGIQFDDSQECSVENSLIDVSGSPVVLHNSSLESKYTPSGNCAEPNTDTTTEST